jgi:hypothetical protein
LLAIPDRLIFTAIRVFPDEPALVEMRVEGRAVTSTAESGLIIASSGAFARGAI